MSRAKKNWIAETHMKKGALHASLKVPKGEHIPEEKLDRAMHSKNRTLRKRATLAHTLESFHHGKR